MGKSKYVVTITRQFGSMGRPIAKKMAEKLGIEYYDRDIVDQAAKKLNLPVSVVDEVEETAKKVKASPFARMMFPLGKGTSNTQDKIFEAQQNIIKFLAEKETCVIVGRCADFTLEEMENAMHIYIYAPYEVRVEHCVKDLNIEVEEARKMIVAIDEAVIPIICSMRDITRMTRTTRVFWWTAVFLAWKVLRIFWWMQ